MFNWIRFPAQEANEEMKYILRRHWVAELWIWLRYALIAAIPIGVYFYAKYYFPNWQSNNEAFALVVIFVSIYYLGVLLFLLNAWLDYYLDVWIITNMKVVSVEQKRMFSRHISRMKFDRIQDVTSDTTGFFATFFKYGDVYIQSAGTKERFVLKQVPQPDEITKTIIRLSKPPLTKKSGKEHADANV